MGECANLKMCQFGNERWEECANLKMKEYANLKMKDL